MTRTFACGILTLIVFAATGAGEDAPKSELEGTWIGVSAVTWEGKQDDDYAKLCSWVIAGDMLTFRVTNKDKSVGEIPGTIKVDAKKSPKTFDAVGKQVGKDANGDFDWTGIYELDGDTLKVCYMTTKGAERPKKFEAKPAVVLILKREKK
jgi:uncharacterized protein (TIGR03067 family)